MDEANATFSAEVSLTEGANEFTATAMDKAGNSGTSATLVVQADFSPPTIELLSDTYVNTTPQDIKVAFSEAVLIDHFNGQDFDPALDPGQLTTTFAAVMLTSGVNALPIRVRDLAGNITQQDLGVVLDTAQPVVTITRVANDAFSFIPPNGLDNVVTNAPNILVSGTVSDALSGVASVNINDYPATIDPDQGTFIVYGLPLIPRSNSILAEATDGAGNLASQSIRVHRDAEGPMITLDLERGIFVSSTGPMPNALDGTQDITVYGWANDDYVNITSLDVRLNNQPLPVAGTSAAFSFVLSAATLASSDLFVLEVQAQDSLNNETIDVQSILSGRFTPGGQTIENAAGAAIGPAGLKVVKSIIEEELVNLDGDEIISDDTEFEAVGIKIKVYGLALCDPPDRNAPPGSQPNPPNAMSPYGCRQQATVNLGINPQGYITVNMEIPFLFVDLYFDAPWYICVGNNANGYVTANPASINLQAEFTQGPNGPELVAVPGSVGINLSNTNVDTTDGCLDFMIDVADFFVDIDGLLQDAFEGQVGALLAGVGSMLQEPIYETGNTEFALKIAYAYNDEKGVYVWLDSSGNPCPDANHYTDKKDDSTPDPGDYLPCPNPAHVTPGTYVTPNASGSLPIMDLLNSGGNPVGLEAGVNDDLVNYLLQSEWAQGTLDLAIDQSFLGDDAPISLDTNSFSLFLPELVNRPDIVEQVPIGSPMAIALYPLMPPIIQSQQVPDPVFHLKAGDLILAFWADANGDEADGFETELFTVAATLLQPVELGIDLGEDIWDDGKVAVDLQNSELYVDLISNPFLVNEASVRSAAPTLIDLALPILTDTLANVVLPANTLAIADDAQVQGTNLDFLMLNGELVHTINIDQPPKDQNVSQDPVFVAGTLTALSRPISAEVRLFIEQGDGQDPIELNPATTGQGPTSDSATFEATVPLSSLAAGKNTLRIVATDNQAQLRASQTFELHYNSQNGQVSRSGGDACGCSAQGPGHPGGLLALCLAALALLIRRKLSLALLPVAVLSLGLGGCTGDPEPPTPPDPPKEFTGAEINPNPVFVMQTLAIGDETQGFNVDESSPDGDPDPDNGLAGLGGIVNPLVADAVVKGDLLLLIQFPELKRLPAPGESGEVTLVGYLGMDLDNDPADNFSGQEPFAIDPRSYKDDGQTMIRIEAILSADASGNISIKGGPTNIDLALPLGDIKLNLSISPAQVLADLSVSALNDRGIEAKNGLLGGVIPASALAQKLEGLPIAPIALVKDKIDVDLNQDGQLDKSDSPDNPDGISAGLIFSGVPALISDDPVNQQPTVILEEIPASVTQTAVEVKGQVQDPDGDCSKAELTIQLNEAEAEQAALSETCTFSHSVQLQFGDNTIVAQATDEKGAKGSAQVEVKLQDDEKPVVEITGPSAPEVTQATQTLTGIATDNIGILGVEIKMNDTIAVITADELAADGSFSQELQLNLGENQISAQAKDLAGNLSDTQHLVLTLLDSIAPQLNVLALSDTYQKIEAPGPYILHAPQVTLEAQVLDNAGLADLSVQLQVDGDQDQAVAFDPESGAINLALELTQGEHNLQFGITDQSGNSAQLDVVVTLVDNHAPELTVLGPAPQVQDPTQVVLFQAQDDFDAPALLLAQVAHNAQPMQPAVFDEQTQQFSLPVTLTLGTNQVLIRVEDTSGNATEIEGSVELSDAQAPVLVLNQPEEGLQTFEDQVTVAGVATDNAGQPEVSIQVGTLSQVVELDPQGNFNLEIPLEMGANTITVIATDAAARVAQEVRTVHRLDPDSPTSLTLEVDPQITMVGAQEVSTLTVSVERLAGGPVPDGLQVSFLAQPDDLGVLSASSALTENGQTQVQFAPGWVAGMVALQATVDQLSDSAQLVISQPTAVRIGLCLAQDASLAGFSADLDLVSPHVQAGTPTSDALSPLAAAGDFFHYNTTALPSTMVLAGTQAITGQSGGSKVAEIALPISTGSVRLEDVSLSNIAIADSLGQTEYALAQLSACDLAHEFGDLPPIVSLQPIASPTEVAEHVITGTIVDADLSTCEGVLSVNGVERAVDVTSGTLTEVISLSAGPNQVALNVIDTNGNEGRDSFWVTLQTPNAPPQISITEPAEAVTTPVVMVRGTVSDADDGLVGLTVVVKVGAGQEQNATIDEQGNWEAQVELAWGTNLIQAIATDARGATASAVQSTELIEPITPPVVTITQPTTGAAVQTPTIEVLGSVTEGGNPSQISVSLRVNAQEQPITFSPFSRLFEAEATLQDGLNTIVVRAEDITGGFDEKSVEVTMSAPDGPPSIEITEPADGARLAVSGVTVKGTVQDDRPLETLAFVRVNEVDASLDTQTGQWQVHIPLAAGNNTLEAIVEDQKGQQASDTIQIEVVEPMVVVINQLQIGGPSDGFNVDSNPPHPLSDANPDNALTGLGAIANEPLQNAINGQDGDPLLLMLEFSGMAELPGPGESVLVDINGYIGVDTDGDPSDNFGGTETFEIDPASYDPETGSPLIHFTDILVVNDFGTIRVDNFPDNPAIFHIELPVTEPPLVIDVNPAYVQTTITEDANGLNLNSGLLGGVLPAATLANPISVGDTEIVPLELLISSDPSAPVPDCDLNADGMVDTQDASASNPDGISIGLTFTAVPASISR